MARVVVSEFLSVDGVMQAPGGRDEDRSGGFEHGGWQFDRSDEEMGQFVMGGLQEAGGFLLGRRTFDIFAAYWPNQPEDDPIAAIMNARPKYVASRTLRNPLEWNNAVVLGSDLAAEVGRLRSEPGGDVLVIGSGDLGQTLGREGLVDTYQLMVYPVLLGSGKRLFRDDLGKRPLRLSGSRTMPGGMVVLQYEPAEQGGNT
ncbi:MAG TPA: dihydrofolate reductase family protein [Actinomycetota bacterium]|jgi:dihydrofolate reductase